jgi:hypothetical protein
MNRTVPIPTLLAAVIACAACCVAARAADDDVDGGPRAQVQAATKDAIANLYDEVTRVQIGRRLSVGEFVDRTRSRDDLVRVLQRAQQIGGPRWIDDKTCQIEVQISGVAVGQALRRVAAANPKDSPISANEISRIVKDWDDRSFSATGLATSRVPVARAKPRTPRMGLQLDPWWNVPDAAREQAVAAAKADAARRSLSSLKPVLLTPRSDVGDVLALKDVNEAMQTWFVAQPAAKVELLEDLRAEVEVAVGPVETFQKFRVLATKQTDVPVPADDQGWAKVRDAFERRMATPIGRAVAQPKAAVRGNDVIGVKPPNGNNLVGVGAEKPLDLPKGAPAWAKKRIQATGRGETGRGKLANARLAEASAEEKLRVQIEDLTLNDGVSIGKAARTDARVAQAIKRALAKAKVDDADYHRDGSADVTVYLDLDKLWQELHDAE